MKTIFNREKSKVNHRTTFAGQFQSITLCFISIVCIFTSLFGCASFKHSSYRIVSDGTTRVGLIDSKVISYGPPKIITAPTEESPTLKLFFPKQVINKYKYETKTHQEEILVKQKSKIEANLPILGGLFGATALWAAFLEEPKILSLGGLAAIFLLLKEPKPSAEIKYLRLPESNAVDYTYKSETESIAATDEILIIDRKVRVKTDKNGIVSFRVNNLSDFDIGVVLSHSSSNSKYLIRRIPRVLTIERDWVEAARKLELGVEAAEALNAAVKLAIGTINPEVVITKIVAGVVIHIVVEKLGTYKEHFFEWVVISTQ